jgi:hypothetical protein
MAADEETPLVAGGDSKGKKEYIINVEKIRIISLLAVCK